MFVIIELEIYCKKKIQNRVKIVVTIPDSRQQVRKDTRDVAPDLAVVGILPGDLLRTGSDRRKCVSGGRNTPKSEHPIA